MTKAATKPELLLWVGDNRGIYIPRDFAQSFADRNKSVRGVNDEDWAILDAGPEHEHYWDVWNTVTDWAIVTDGNGIEYNVYHDGDCWLIPKGMEWSEAEGFFIWPASLEEEASP